MSWTKISKQNRQLRCRYKLRAPWRNLDWRLQHSKSDGRAVCAKVRHHGFERDLREPGGGEHFGDIGNRRWMDRLSELLCIIESRMHSQGPIATKKVETIVSRQAAPAVGAPIQHSVSMDVGRAGALGAQQVQYQGFGDVTKPVSRAQADERTTSYARIVVLDPGGERTKRIEHLSHAAACGVSGTS